MKANVRKIKKLRKYSEEFKKELVKEFESGKHSVLELERLYSIRNGLIYRWIYKYSTFNEKGYRVVENKSSSGKKVRQLEQKIKDLEAALGRKQITIDYLETMIEVAKEELNVDIKKNYSTQPSGDSKEASK